MWGYNYDSPEKFQRACRREEERVQLDPQAVLSKIYSAPKLRKLARTMLLNLADDKRDQDEPAQCRGVGVRSEIASSIVQQTDPVAIGAALARYDHQMFFPYLTYYKLPDRIAPYSSLQAFVEYIRDNDHDLIDNFLQIRNGITKPVGAAPSIESILVDGESETASLLFSCSRILVSPDGNHSDYRSYFLARLPVIVRVLFRHRMVEFSAPVFAEPQACGIAAVQREPERYQTTFFRALRALMNLVPAPLVTRAVNPVPF